MKAHRRLYRTTPDAVEFAEERLSECFEEYFDFVHAYWDGAPENVNEPPLDFNYEVYEALDRAGSLLLVVGRYYGEMVAAALYIVIANPKHRTLRSGQCDTFAVARQWRGKGLGTRMMECVVSVMQEHDVRDILNGYREVFGETVPLFEKLGFVLYERFYHLVIPTRVAIEGEN